MDLNAMMTVEQIAQETNEPQENVLLDFMKSNTAEMLYDDATKLWWDGPSAVAEEYKSQKIRRAYHAISPSIALNFL